mmetsp:Transcript_52874/g.149919  ORF Transcript_52874/g.149919 Transcript_52874/m.149919 type:complete len:87 (-) Transcript_52874:126-386(-)
MRSAGGGAGGRQDFGFHGCGDHRQDLQQFVSKNCLDVRTQEALETLSEVEQKKVMGTDGGPNSFVLIDKVANPNAVVMSRLRTAQR